MKETGLGGLNDDAEGKNDDEITIDPALDQMLGVTDPGSITDSNSDSDLSVHSADSLARRRALSTTATPMPDSNDDYSFLDDEDETPKSTGPSQLRQNPVTPIARKRAKTAPAEGSSQPPTQSASTKIVKPKEKSKEKSKEKPKEKPKEKRKRSAAQQDSESEEEVNKRAEWKKKSGRISMAESMLQQAMIEDTRLKTTAKEDREERLQLFMAEIKQRDQHHEAASLERQILANESKERLMRITMEFNKQEDERRGRSKSDS